MNELSSYAPPLSVWRVIEECVSPEKLPLVRSYLGESRVDYCNDMRQELETLLEIWEEIKETSEPLILHQSKRSSSLPEPPQQREMLIREIQLLLESLKEKENGIEKLPSDCNQNILRYASDTSESPARTFLDGPNLLSGNSRPSTPLRNSTSRNSQTSSLEDNALSDVARNVTVSEIERSTRTLRDALQIEYDILTEDIELLRKCVEEGHCATIEKHEPTITELRQERKKLENHLLKDVKISPKLKGFSKPRPGSSPVKSVMRKLELSTPIIPTRDLPPVRPPSAPHIRTHPLKLKEPISQTQNSISTFKSSGISLEKTEENPFVYNPKWGGGQPQISKSPLLGARSHTFPVDVRKKEPDNLRKQKSSPHLQMTPNNQREQNMTEIDVEIQNNEQFHPFSHPTGREYGNAFCGTPDSGVSSRPESGLGTLGFGTENVQNSMNPSVSSIDDHPTPYFESSYEKDVKRNLTTDFTNNKFDPPNFLRDFELGPHKSVMEAKITHTQVPKPPPQARPQCLSRMSLRRLRITSPPSVKEKT